MSSETRPHGKPERERPAVESAADTSVGGATSCGESCLHLAPVDLDSLTGYPSTRTGREKKTHRRDFIRSDQPPLWRQQRFQRLFA